MPDVSKKWLKSKDISGAAGICRDRGVVSTAMCDGTNIMDLSWYISNDETYL